VDGAGGVTGGGRPPAAAAVVAARLVLASLQRAQYCDPFVYQSAAQQGFKSC
jgi:hypothetical protein